MKFFCGKNEIDVTIPGKNLFFDLNIKKSAKLNNIEKEVIDVLKHPIGISPICELVKDKTLIVIAHKLATIKNAEQILVIDEGKIVQQGIHDDLIKEEGLYNTFWERRTRARSWKIQQG